MCVNTYKSGPNCDNDFEHFIHSLSAREMGFYQGYRLVERLGSGCGSLTCCY